MRAPTGLLGIHQNPCPHCNARPGFRCRSVETGVEMRPGHFHEARIAIAERLRREHQQEVGR